jgi:hypothetical protein
MNANPFRLVIDNTARLAPSAAPAAVARMLRYRRTGSAPGMPRWYVEDYRRRMTARNYIAPAYSPRRYLTRLDNEAHRAFVFAQLGAVPQAVTMAQYVRAWNKVNGYKVAA